MRFNINKFVSKKNYENLSLLFILLIILFFIYYLINSRRININIGLLYTSEGGSMAVNEIQLLQTVKRSVKIFNESQNKYYINTIEFNPKSDTELYKKGAEILLTEYDLTMVIGVWRSIDRKAVKPIFEKHNNLLNYVVQYEGNECSKNILYYGACPNQQIDIGIEYSIKNISNNIILIGSDYVFPRTANSIMKKYIQNYNSRLLMEKYVALDETQFDSICDELINLLETNKKCVILNTINGDSNFHFFNQLHKKFKSIPKYKDVVRSDLLPIVSFSIGEGDLTQVPIEEIYGDIHIWNYSQNDKSYDTFLNTKMETNNKVLNNLLLSFKQSKNIEGDPNYHAFLSVLFFCDFLLDYKGVNFDSKTLRDNYILYKNKKILTNTGFLKLNDNNHLDNPVLILKINEDKRYETIYRTPIEITPNPWFDKFSNIKYECNNKLEFLGEKYIQNENFNNNFNNINNTKIKVNQNINLLDNYQSLDYNTDNIFNNSFYSLF